MRSLSRSCRRIEPAKQQELHEWGPIDGPGAAGEADRLGGVPHAPVAQERLQEPIALVAGFGTEVEGVLQVAGCRVESPVAQRVVEGEPHRLGR